MNVKALGWAISVLFLVATPIAMANEDKVLLVCGSSAYEIDYQRALIRYPTSDDSYPANITDSAISWTEKLGRMDDGTRMTLNRYTGELSGTRLGKVTPKYFRIKCTVSQKKF